MAKRKLVWIPVLAAAALGIYLAVSFWVSANWLVVRKFQTGFGQNGGTVRLAVLGDLHDHEFGEHNRELAEKVKEQEPDLILLLGDMLNGSSSSASVPLELIELLKETAPVYYALGNHELEYEEKGHPELIRELEEAGAEVLEKEYVDLTVGGVKLRLGGMYEYAFGLNGNNDALAAPEDVLDFLMEFQDTDRLKIMMSHRPDSFIFGDASQVWDIDLVISAHNHGGQVVLPFAGGLYGGDQGWFPQYVHGLYDKDNLRLFITSGLGTDREKFPRFNNPPEIAVLDVTL